MEIDVLVRDLEAAVLDEIIEAGATHVLDFVFYQSTSAIIPLQNVLFTYRILPDYDSTVPYVEYVQNTDPEIVVDQPAGRLTITTSDTDTGLFKFKTGVHELWAYDIGTDYRFRVFKGSVRVIKTSRGGS